MLHPLYVGEFLGILHTICTTFDALFGITELPIPIKEGDFACQVKLNFGQVLSFWSKLDPIEGLQILCRVNLWMKLADVPPGVKVHELASVPASMNMVQSNVVKEFPFLDVYSVGKVHHVFNFELATMAGYFNSYGAQFRLNCLTKAVDEIDASKHVSSSTDLYGKSFPCLATSMFYCPTSVV
jgi:hypothetical protein